MAIRNWPLYICWRPWSRTARASFHPCFEKIGIGPQAVLSDVYKEIEKLPKVSGTSGANQPSMSSQVNQLLEKSFKEADTFKDEYVSTEHMLLALTSLKRDPAQELLARHGATHDAILKALNRGSRIAAHHRPESGRKVPGARALRPRSDGAGAAGQA